MRFIVKRSRTQIHVCTCEFSEVSRSDCTGLRALMSTGNDLTGFKTLVNQPSAPPVVSN